MGKVIESVVSAAVKVIEPVVDDTIVNVATPSIVTPPFWAVMVSVAPRLEVKPIDLGMPTILDRLSRKITVAVAVATPLFKIKFGVTLKVEVAAETAPGVKLTTPPVRAIGYVMARVLRPALDEAKVHVDMPLMSVSEQFP